MRVRSVLQVCLLAAACTNRPARSPEATFEVLAEAVQERDEATVERLVDFAKLAESIVRESYCGTQSYLDSVAGRPGSPCGQLPPQATSDSAIGQHAQRLRNAWGVGGGASASPDEELPGLWVEVEPAGYGTTQFRGDTALIERMLRDPRLNTTFRMRYVMVPLDSVFWRVVGVHDIWRPVLRRQQLQHARLKAVNDSAGAALRRAVIATFAATKIETGWDKYDFEFTATIRNPGPHPLRLYRPFAFAPADGPVGEPSRVVLDDGLVSVAPGDSVARRVRYPFRPDGLNEARILAARDELQLLAERAAIGPEEWDMFVSWEDFVRRGPSVGAVPPGVQVRGMPPNSVQHLAHLQGLADPPGPW